MENAVSAHKKIPAAEEIPIADGELRLYRGWLGPRQALDLFVQLREELVWEQSEIRIHGKQQLIPRLNAWYGDPGAGYRYSGKYFEPLAWTPGLAAVRERLAETLGMRFNSVLANLYRDGADSVGWHSDDEKELGVNPLIASVSLGAERRFVLKHKRNRDMRPIELVLPSGSVLVMAGPTQHFWRHQLPKTRKPVGPRINLTFRRIINGTGNGEQR